MLFATFISHKEMLDWYITKNYIHSALVDEAYGRWLKEDKEQAQLYANSWTGTVDILPFGYRVEIEAESDTIEYQLIVPAEMVDRAHELVSDLRGVNGEISLLGLENLMDIVSLDAQSSEIMEELADEYIALLSDAGLIPPLMETE